MLQDRNGGEEITPPPKGPQDPIAQSPELAVQFPVDWVPRAFAFLLVIMLGILAVDLVWTSAIFEEECWRCAYVKRHGEPLAHGWCGGHPKNRVCPSCGNKWGATEISWRWVPWDQWYCLPFIFLLAALPAFLTAARVARCPDCGGCEFVRHLRRSSPSAPCPRCMGRGRVTFLNQWFVLRRRLPRT
jgi:hypothetical protein